MHIFSTPQHMKMLAEVSSGLEKASLVIEHGDLINVYSGELLKNQSIAIKDNWIAYVGPDVNHCIGSETIKIDASGRILIPGLIDAHTHLLYYCSPDEFLRYGMRGGTTTIVSELPDVTFSFQYSGLLELLDGMHNQPIKIFFSAPPSIALSEGFRKRAPNLDQLIHLLHRDDIVGVGEGYWQDVSRGNLNFSELSAEALRLRKSVEGHAAGCRAEKLRAYLDHGVSSCHESVSIEEVLEKMRLGICVMIREGSVRKELEAMSGLSKMPIDFRRLALVSDSIDPRELMKNGYMEFILQRAIDLGFDPIKAIQMTTINPAEHFHLDGLLGGIAPGKYADIVIIPHLRTIHAEYVISNGQIIAKHGKLNVQPHKVRLSVGGLGAIKVTSSDFKISVAGNNLVKVRVIDQITEVITREAFVDMLPVDGELKVDIENDILKVSLITWEGKIFTGFIRGLGLTAGALASSYAWEAFGIVVVAACDDDMAQAVNRISELSGGVVLYINGQCVVELPLPIGGMISNLPLEKTGKKLDAVQETVRNLGFRSADALLTLGTLTTPAIPFIRISEDGLVDLRDGQVVGLIIK